MAPSPLAWSWTSAVRAVILLSIIFDCVQAYQQLSEESLAKAPLARLDDFDVFSGSLLSPILVPRVPGTPGSAAVQRHFVDFFTQQLPDWEQTWHNVTYKTPATGDRDVPFTNLVFTRDPPWASKGDVGRLTLVAHYDSLHRPDGFIGATDSAAPCAMLMHVAKGIDAALSRKWATAVANNEAGDGLEEDKGVQIIFLDGEEAWETWSDTDSLYGARALAEHWESTHNSASSTHPTPLNAIDLFLLIDLLGAADPNVPSYFARTHHAYRGLARAEARMRKAGLMRSKPGHGSFLPEEGKRLDQFHRRGFIADDHIPFMMRGVPILHVIPTPFPPTWHTMQDDAAHLDQDTVLDWASLLTVFAAEWMELDGFIAESDDSKSTGQKTRERSEL